jgi:hypothetical protein
MADEPEYSIGALAQAAGVTPRTPHALRPSTPAGAALAAELLAGEGAQATMRSGQQGAHEQGLQLGSYQFFPKPHERS